MQIPMDAVQCRLAAVCMVWPLAVTCRIRVLALNSAELHNLLLIAGLYALQILMGIAVKPGCCLLGWHTAATQRTVGLHAQSVTVSGQLKIQCVFHPSLFGFRVAIEGSNDSSCCV